MADDRISGIKRRREAKGLTQMQLAVLMEVSISTIQRWDRSIESAHVSNLIKLARILDCSIDDLLEDAL